MLYSFCGLGNNEAIEFRFEDNLSDIKYSEGLLFVAKNLKKEPKKQINFWGITAI